MSFCSSPYQLPKELSSAASFQIIINSTNFSFAPQSYTQPSSREQIHEGKEQENWREFIQLAESQNLEPEANVEALNFYLKNLNHLIVTAWTPTRKVNIQLKNK